MGQFETFIGKPDQTYDPIFGQSGKVCFGTFWDSLDRKTGKPDFPRKMIWVSFKPLLAPTFMCKIRKNLCSNSQINLKSPLSGRFGPVLPNNRETGLFLKNRAYGSLTPCKESEKTNEPILRKVGN